MPSKLSSDPASMSTPPKKKRKGGFFGCRSKHALDSLPRNARGESAAIHRLQAQNIFHHTPESSSASTAAAVNTPLTEEKGLLRLAELNSSASLAPLPPAQPASPVKPLYAQEVAEGANAEDDTAEFEEAPTHLHEADVSEYEEARDAFYDDVSFASPSRPNTPGVVRSLSVASKTGGRIKRSLSLKRSGSTASAKLIARAPPVSSADFADLPASSSSSSDLTAKEDAAQQSLGDMVSIRKARGRHQTAVLHQHMIPDITEDEYVTVDHFNAYPDAAAEEHARFGSAEEDMSPLKKRAMAVTIPDSDSMRASQLHWKVPAIRSAFNRGRR